MSAALFNLNPELIYLLHRNIMCIVCSAANKQSNTEMPVAHAFWCIFPHYQSHLESEKQGRQRERWGDRERGREREGGSERERGMEKEGERTHLLVGE